MRMIINAAYRSRLRDSPLTVEDLACYLGSSKKASSVKIQPAGDAAWECVGPDWKRHEHLFQVELVEDSPPRTLWVDSVPIAETAEVDLLGLGEGCANSKVPLDTVIGWIQFRTLSEHTDWGTDLVYEILSQMNEEYEVLLERGKDVVRYEVFLKPLPSRRKIKRYITY